MRVRNLYPVFKSKFYKTMVGKTIGMNELEISLVAHRVMQNLDRDKSDFSESPDEDLIQAFKLKIEENDHLNPLEKLRKEVEMKKQKIDNYMSHYHPLMNISEGLLHKSVDEYGLKEKISAFHLTEIRESLHKGNVWETLKYTRLIIAKVQKHIDELANKELFLRIIEDLHLFAENLHRAEMEYAEAVHQRDMAELEHLYSKEQLGMILEEVLEMSDKIYSGHNQAKLNDYSIEGIMAEWQMKRTVPQ